MKRLGQAAVVFGLTLACLAWGEPKAWAWRPAQNLPQPFKASHAGANLVGLLLPPGLRIRPAKANTLLPVLAWAKGSALAVINGGFFNHADGRSVSWAIADGRVLADPNRNPKLVQNRALAPYLPIILHRRTAWLAYPGQPERWAFGPPDRRGPQGERPVAMLQAGPSLLPYPAAEQEAFLRNGPSGGRVDAIQARGKAPRSALGLRADGTMIWLVAQSPGLTLGEVSAAMLALGAQQAMALDGGSSSALAWRDGERWLTAYGPKGGSASVDTVLIAYED